MKKLDIELKELVISTLNLENIAASDILSDQPLFGEGLGLDSIDALELGIAIKKKYQLSLNIENSDVKQHFFSIQTLSDFIQKNSQELS